jgi:hypothetical protein
MGRRVAGAARQRGRSGRVADNRQHHDPAASLRRRRKRTIRFQARARSRGCSLAFACGSGLSTRLKVRRHSRAPHPSCVDGPQLARVLSRACKWRHLAVMCPASHEGGPCQASSHINLHAPFDPSSTIASFTQGRALTLQSSPCKTSHPAELGPTTVPHSGQESSRRVAPLCGRRRSRRQAGQRRHPLGSACPSRLAPRAQPSQAIRTRVSQSHLPAERPVSRTATGR